LHAPVGVMDEAGLGVSGGQGHVTPPSWHRCSIEGAPCVSRALISSMTA
jgi:hypothetical protein